MENGLLNYAEDFEKKQENVYEKWLKPAIYIGMGGFGCNVVRTIKKTAKDYIGNRLLKALGFIGLDTHSYSPQDILTKGEYIELSVGAVPTIVARNNSKLFDWYLALTKKWSADSIAGANMVRAVGRLSFINPPAHTSFMNSLRAAYNQISNFKKGNELTVYIISSLAGGTGSGMLLDVFASVREFFKPIFGGQVKIQAFLATPEPLENEAPPINLPNFYANTYAAIKEIYHFLGEHIETVTYGTDSLNSKISFSAGHLPNSIFIVSNGNEIDVKVAKRFEHLGNLLANYLLLDILTPVEQLEGKPVIHRGENPIYGIGNDGMLRFASSFGMSKFGFPFNEVVEYFNYLLLDYYLDQELTRQRDAHRDARQWILDAGITEYQSDALQDALIKTGQGDKFKVILNIEGDFEDVKRENLMKTASEMVKGKKDIVISQVEELIKQNSDVLKSTTLSSFQEKLNELLKISIGTAYEFIQSTLNEIQRHLSSLEQEVSETESNLRKSNENLKNAVSNIGVAAKSGFWGRKDRIRAAILAFQTELQQYIDISIKLISQQAGLELYQYIIDNINDQNRKYEELIQKVKAKKEYIKSNFHDLRGVLERLSDMYNRKLGNRFSFVKIQHINDLYEEIFGDETRASISKRLMKEFRGNGLLMDPLIPENDWIQSASKFTLTEIRDKMKNIDIVDMFKKFYDDDERKRLLDFLQSISSPLFPLNPTHREQGYQTVWIIAAHDSIRDRFLEIFEPHISDNDGIQIASSNNPYEIFIYTVRHGYTIHSNSRITTYKANYDSLQRMYMEKPAVPPIHSWYGAWTWDEIIPEIGEREGELYFILGRAFSWLFPSHMTRDNKPDDRRNQAFIYNRGRYYYLRDEDGREIRLGDGLDEAIESFTIRRDLIELIRDEVEQKIQTEGAQNIKPKLEEYMNLMSDDIDKSHGERRTILEGLQRQLANYIKEMQSRLV